jgi:hypothetical protein
MEEDAGVGGDAVHSLVLWITFPLSATRIRMFSRPFRLLFLLDELAEYRLRRDIEILPPA